MRVMIIPEFLLDGWVNYQVITFQGNLALQETVRHVIRLCLPIILDGAREEGRVILRF